MENTSLIDYTLYLADNALILGHRNSEWTGHGPILEQDIALSNISLDLIGQARNLYQYAARVINEDEGGHSRTDGRVTEDTLAYLRDVWDYRNCLLAEQDNGDWGKTILRQFFFSTWQFYFYERLQQSQDKELAAIAVKSLKEVTYHLRWSSEWVIRLGDGSDESLRRMKLAMDQLWTFTGELFVPADYETALVEEGIAVDLAAIRPLWDQRVDAILQQARLTRPADVWEQTGGKQGRHTEHLGYLLAEMQFLQRAYPGNEW